MSADNLICKGIYDWELDWEGGLWKGRNNFEHIESKEFILQLKTPRRDVIIHVKELIRVASLFPTVNVMTARRIPTPKFYWPTINGMFLE